MKLYLVLFVCALAAASPSHKVAKEGSFDLSALLAGRTLEERSTLVNILVNQLLAFLRRIINNGWELFDIPPLDPLDLEYYHLVIPAGLINLDLKLKNIHATGIGGFNVHKSKLDLSDMTFDIDISVPTFEVRADEYDLIGDLFTAIPLYGKGLARFHAVGFRFQAKIYLKQSDDKKSILIDRIEEASFVLPSLQCNLTGAIGGGDIDAIVNAMVEEVIVDYVNRFQGAISKVAASLVQAGLNPILGQLDTWKYIDPLI